MHVRLSRTVLFAVLTLFANACAGGRPKPPCGDGLCETGETWEMC